MAGNCQGFPQVRMKFCLINAQALVDYHWEMIAREIHEGLLLPGIMVKC